MPCRYLHLDVFTNHRLEGNQLAVVFDAPHLSPDVMQAVAREMAFSETVFVLPPEVPGTMTRLRIFTPANELPMAGHPTIGATFALVWEGRVPRGQQEIVLGLGIGPTRMALEWDDAVLVFAWMSQPLPRFGATVADRALVADVLGLQPGDLVTDLPVQSVSCGIPFLFVPLTTRAAVDRASLEARGISRLARDARIDEQGVFVFTLEAVDPHVTAYSRMFAPSLGVAEDPATGSASGPLGCYLVQRRLVSPAAQERMVSLQGVKMQRPSRIVISIAGRPDNITGVRIGGTSVLVAEGTLHL